MDLQKCIRTVLTFVAIAAATLNFVSMTPVAAASECHQMHANADEGHELPAANPCCGSAHCCPLLPPLPVVTAPAVEASGHRCQSMADQPLLLITAIDPPPRKMRTREPTTIV